MRLKFYLTLFVVLTFCSLQRVFSLGILPFANEQYAIHLNAGLLYNVHQSDFSHFQGAIDCGIFQSGQGLGYSLGSGIEIKFDEKSHFGLTAYLIDRSGLLTLKSGFISLDTTINEVVNVETENTIDTKLSFIEIQPEFRRLLSKDFINGPLRALLALRILFPIKSDFTQSESIITPDNAVFSFDGRRQKSRIVSEGIIGTMNSMILGISVGLENMLKIGNDNYLTQQLLFDYNLSNFTNDVEWKSWAIRFELGLRFSKHSHIDEPQEHIIEPEIEDSIIISEESSIPLIVPEPQIWISQKYADLEILTGNELLASPPLINAVFFERNSSEIPEFYDLEHGLDSYYGEDPVLIHKHVLHRIRDIINKNPNSTIVLEGTTSGAEYEPLGTELSGKRALEVEKAFLKLGIPKNKIIIEKRIFPRYPSNQDFERGIIENQRVDIVVKNAPLQEYVNIQKYAELNGTVAFNADFINIPKDKFVNFRCSFGKENLLLEKPLVIPFDIKIRLNDDKAIMQYFGQLSFDSLESIYKNEIDLSKLPRRQVELSYENFEAIMTFDYNSSELSVDNKGLLKQLSEFLPDGFTIILFGSADALGTEQRNIQLERERADAAENYIRSISGTKFKIERRTEYFKKFSDDTQQGRFLNRCIRIKLKK